MKMNYSKGSEWRRWDLHVHAPGTKLSDAYSCPGDILDEFAHRIEACSADVIGITDYFSIDAYENFNEKFKELYPKSRKVIFPNIEFRLSETIGEPGTHPHFHIIFDLSDVGCTIADVRDFLSRLELYEKGENNKPLYCSFLKTKLDFEAASVLGSVILDTLSKVFGEKKPYILAFPANNDGIRSTDASSPRNVIISDELDKSSDLFFGKNGNRDYFLREDRYENGASKPKPVVSGSDAHSFEDLKRIDNQQEGFEFTWIKADSTFEGLRQIIREPEDRVFIGEKPPKLKENEANSTKIIDSIKINSVNHSNDSGWFSNSNKLYLNSGLVAIIGNKGSGKSALADILALAGNSTCEAKDYSFLNKDKFRKAGLASKFETELTWCDNTSQESINLGEDNDAKVDQVIYLPQSKLEKICADTSAESFQHELERVIFSRLDESQKGDYETFQDLVQHRDEGHQEKIEALRRQIQKVNKQIIEHEYYQSKEFRASIKSNLEEKQREWTAHEASKPEEVEQPKEGSSTNDKQNAIARKRNELEECSGKITTLRTESVEVESKITIVKNLLKKLENFNESFNRLKTETEADFKEIDVVFDAVIKLQPTQESLRTKLKEFENRKSQIGNEFDLFKEDNLRNKETKLRSDLGNLQAELDKPAQDYQKYLTADQEWKVKKLAIEGEGEQPASGTIKNLYQWLNYINEDSSNLLRREKEKRRELALAILKEMESIIRDRNELYKPVIDMFDYEKIVKQKFDFGFHSQISEKGFAKKFFDYMNRGVAGSFYGVDESEKLLDELLNGVESGNVEGWPDLLEKIDNHLHKDMRDGREEEITVVSEQLKSDKNVEELYDFLWSLGYLKAELALKLDRKPIDQLSPGERGSLLLVFYLLLDTSRIPIIVDQPEENLDNETVYKLLVPTIKKAKEQRQVIMVTHNPNIAVVCDAEQIIHSDINKRDNNKVTYTSGAIEAPKINKYLVNVLEGTQKAFNNRREKYIEK